MATLRSALVFSIMTKYSLSILGLISTIVVARLLSPGEIGLFAIASSTVMLLSEVRLLGAGTYLIREDKLTPEKIRAALGLTLIISWGIGVVIILAAPFFAQFYDYPELRNVLWILSIGFFFAPYISIPFALLSRDYKQKELFYIRLSASLINLISTLVFIRMGMSFYALAWANTATMFVQLIGQIYFSPAHMEWLPRFSQLRPIAKLGIFSSVAGMIKRFQINLPDLVIGKVGTTAQVGLFSRGLGFIEFLFQSLVMGVAPVSLPYLSNTKRAGGSIQEAYIKATLYLGGIVWPVLAVASVVSLPAIRLFFGDQWDMAAPVASIMAFWSIFRAVHAFSQQAMISIGYESLMLKKEVIIFASYIVSMVVMAPYGLVPLAYTMLVVSGIDVIASNIVLKMSLGLKYSEFLVSMIPNMLITFFCWLTAYGISLVINFNSTSPIQVIGVVSVVLPPVWFVSAAVVKHPLISEIKRIIPKGILRSGQTRT